METQDFDVMIVGAGASGLLAAVYCASHGLRTAVFEKNAKPGKKILASGNGRCNLLNVNVSEDAYNQPKFARQLLSLIPPAAVIDYFYSLGLLTKTDAEGRVYPYSERATSVLRVLLNACVRHDVQILSDCAVSDIQKSRAKFCVLAGGQKYTARYLIFAVGSAAGAAKSGSLELLANAGHRIKPFQPSLCPIVCEAPWGAVLQGTRIKTRATLYKNEVRHFCDRGEILFKNDGISGILAFQLSAFLARDPGANYRIELDLMPDYAPETIGQMLSDFLQNQTMEDALAGIFPKPLAKTLLTCATISENAVVLEKEIAALTRLIKRFPLIPLKNYGLQDAQAASGGLITDDFINLTLESKQVKNLYCTGETLDIDGLSGGYNLLFAWCSALACGKDIVYKESRK